jgi:DNA-binding transcriptional LysR family regulator
MTLSTRSMKVFIRAVEDKSFAAAARNLLLDPAAVSRTIRGLEDELGVLLFSRSTRVSKLTSEGKKFYRDCLQILQRLDAVAQRFRNDDNVLRGELRIGLAPTIPRRMVTAVLPQFQLQYPDIQLQLLSIIDPLEIANGNIDLLLRTRALRKRGGAHKDLSGLVIRKLIQSRIVVCASPAYLRRAGTPVTPNDLAGHACVALVTLERDVQNEWPFSKTGVVHKVKFFPKLLVQGEALREVALAGCGIIRLLACHVQDELLSGDLVQILADWNCGSSPAIVALYRNAKQTRPRVSAFVQHLVQAFRPYNVETA